MCSKCKGHGFYCIALHPLWARNQWPRTYVAREIVPCSCQGVQKLLTQSRVQCQYENKEIQSG